MMIKDFKNTIIALLFACGDPVELSRLVELFEIDKDVLKDEMDALAVELEKEGPLLLRCINDEYTLCTKPKYDHLIRELTMPTLRSGLSNASMEALAIIAYNQPVTRADVEEIRGVNSDGSITKLLERNLIEERGRKDAPGRPMLFGTTDEFLKVFGLQNLKELPGLESFDLAVEEIE